MGTAWGPVFTGGVAERLPLLGFKHFVNAELCGVHLAVHSHLQLCFTFEKRVKLLRMVSFKIHIHSDAVVHGLLLVAENIDTFFRITADVIDFAFLNNREVFDHFADVMAGFLFRAVNVMLGNEGCDDNKG